MNTNNRSLSPSEAARKLGVSTKTLRIYEERSLLLPARTEAGWRCYRPQDIEVASKIVALRKLGLSLGQVARVLSGDRASLDAALATHEQDLVNQMQELEVLARKVRILRSEMAAAPSFDIGDLAEDLTSNSSVVASFELPWPWGGETFDVVRPATLNFIIGPLASGKTRFAKRLADVLPGGRFLDLDRLLEGDAYAGGDTGTNVDISTDLKRRVDVALEWLADEGAEITDALVALLAGLEGGDERALVVDLIEQHLDAATQKAVGSYLRQIGRRKAGRNRRPLFVMTRSSAVLDLDLVEPDTGIILCPPNHSPPIYVPPHRGAKGYEAVSLCLGHPDVRKRTEGVVAIRPTKSA